jgi:hypothetical protein
MFFRREVELTKEILRRLTATDVILINRSKIIDGYRVDGLAESLDATTDRSNQVATRVMIGNIPLSWHRLPLEQD